MSSTQIEHVATGMGSVPAVRTPDGEVRVVFRPAVEALGLSYGSAMNRLKRTSWAVVFMTKTTGSDGKTYKMATVPVETWIMFLATIEEDRVADNLKPLVVEFQKRSSAALRDFWLDGVAVGDHATQEQLVEARKIITLKEQRIAGIVAGARRLQDRTDREVALQLESERSKREEIQYQLALSEAYSRYLREFTVHCSSRDAMTKAQFRKERFD